jgi:ArsR family transcriptional regulator
MQVCEDDGSRTLDAASEIDVIQTTLLRALASPHRLRIIHLLGERPREVHELADELRMGQATVSQHLASMRNVGLVEATRDGRSVRYQLTDAQILAACGLMRDVIVRRLSVLGSLAAAAGAERPGISPRTADLPTRAPAPSVTGLPARSPQVTHR